MIIYFSYEYNPCFTFYNNKYEALLKKSTYQSVLQGILFLGDVNIICTTD